MTSVSSLGPRECANMARCSGCCNQPGSRVTLVPASVNAPASATTGDAPSPSFGAASNSIRHARTLLQLDAWRLDAAEEPGRQHTQVRLMSDDRNQSVLGSLRAQRDDVAKRRVGHQNRSSSPVADRRIRRRRWLPSVAPERAGSRQGGRSSQRRIAARAPRAPSSFPHWRSAGGDRRRCRFSPTRLCLRRSRGG